MIALLPLFKVNIPANALLLFNKIMEIAAFDIIEINDTLNSLLNLEPTGPYRQNFDAVGFESIYLLNNLGALNFAYLFWSIAALFTIILKCCDQESKTARKVKNRVSKFIFFNPIISIFLESYSLIAVCCFINISYISFENYGVTVHTLACLIFMVSIFAVPILGVKFLLKFFSELGDIRMKKIYGNSYD